MLFSARSSFGAALLNGNGARAREMNKKRIRLQIDRERQPDAAEPIRPHSTLLTITPEERLELRKSLMELSKRRQVTAVKPTMSPHVISTTNVYHFFAKYVH